MKKIFYLAIIIFTIVSLLRLFMASVQSSRYNGVQAQGIIANNTEYPTSTRTPVPTSTLIPTSTIDYQQTAIVAQSTADEARRINSMATAEYVRLLNEQLAMTAAIEQQNFMIQSWTITAALTTIPLTATQQAVNNTQIPMNQQIIAAQLTATKNAPTQIVAMENAKNYVRFAEGNEKANIIAKLSIPIFLLGVLAFMFLYPMPKKLESIETEEVEEESAQESEIKPNIMERHFAIVLLQMKDAGSKIDLTEEKWVLSKKFTYDGFDALRECWKKDGIIMRVSDKQNATYEVIDWDKVRMKAGIKNPPPPLAIVSPSADSRGE